MIVRAARTADVDRLLEVHGSAFPDPRGMEARRRNFLENSLGDFSQLRVVEDGTGCIVAHAFLFPLEAWFGGRAVRAGGIATLGVAPEARSRGVGTHLLGALHAESERRGDAVTILFPFRQGFYARVGYAPVTPTRRLELTPRAVPAAWQSLPAGTSVRAAEGGDRQAIEAAYARAAARATGWITRPARLWDRLLLDERRRWFVVLRESALVGFLSWSARQAEAHAAATLIVHDLVADDDEARRALLGVIGAQCDQIHQAILEVDARDPLDRALVDADGARHGTAEVEHSLGQLVAGPMVRLVDIARALEARGWAEDGALSLEVDGAKVGLTSRAGKARVTGAELGTDLVLSRAALAAIAFGALAPSAAARIGWLRGRDASTLARADAIFAMAPYFAIDPF